MRVLLVLMLVHGLAPGLAEVGEALVHYARTGHVAHTAGDADLGDRGPEHGCGPTLHHCTCCAATQALTPSSDAVVASLDGGAARPLPPPELALARREPARPFRPPIS